MEKIPRPGCAIQAQVAGAVLLFLSCPGMLWVYFVRDYWYVEGTLRRTQDAFVTGIQIGVGALGVAVVLGLVYGAIGAAGLWTRWASPAARGVYEAIELKRADHLELPDGLSTYTVTHNYNQRQLAPVAAESGLVIDAEAPPPALPGPAPHEDFQAGTSRIAQMVARGHIDQSGASILVGYAGAQPLQMRAAEWGLAIVAGQSGKGKSSLAGLIIAQAALAGWAIIVCDPVYHREERSLLRDFLSELTGAIWKQAVTPEEIAAAVATAMGIANKRLTEGVSGARVLLVVDEFSTVAGRKMLDAEQMEELFLTATKASAVGVHTLLIAHDLSGSWFGGQSARRGRDQATHRLICNMSPTAASAILPNQAYAQQVAVLPVGQALFFDGWQEPALASFPKLAPKDFAYAARGATPRAYTPWQPRTLAPTPPDQVVEPARATPAARTVPPTTHLDIKASELILDTLAASRDELDAEAIAERTRLPVGTVKNTLSRLVAEKIVAFRRQSRRYVYSVSPVTLQP